ncbi:MAG TPA: cytochrome c oxidase assembly protein [Ktedonobacteraceae bacterium]|nr:cytochrome c oxidase assembly protein [Ktedonobacteraceae bacterium]
MWNGLDLSWPWNPVPLIGLMLLCLGYGFGMSRVSKSEKQDEAFKKSRIGAFIAAVLLVAIVYLTPLYTIARTQLFFAHMVQAVTLTTFCAPLLLLAVPAWLVEPLLASKNVRFIARSLTQPVIASIIFNVTFLFWHIPGIFHFALLHTAIYNLELLTFLLTALLNWWPLIGPVRELHTVTYPQQMLYVFLDGQPLDIYAFLLVFSGVVIYPFYAIPPQLGISAFADQAMGGALLLLPGLIDLVVMTPLFFLWLSQIEQKARIADQQRQELADAQARLKEAGEHVS